MTGLFAFEYSAAIVMRASTDRTLSDSDVSSLRELSAPQGANGSSDSATGTMSS